MARATDNTVIYKTISVATMPKKVVVVEVVNIRTARGGDNAPLIISIPKTVADAAKLRKGDKMRIYTDGQKVYIDRLEQPEI